MLSEECNAENHERCEVEGCSCQCHEEEYAGDLVLAMVRVVDTLPWRYRSL